MQNAAVGYVGIHLMPPGGQRGGVNGVGGHEE